MTASILLNCCTDFGRVVDGFGEGGSWVPAGEFEDAAEADGVEGFGATALTAEAGEFDEHFGGAGGITARTRCTFSSPIWTKIEPESASKSRATVSRSRR